MGIKRVVDTDFWTDEKVMLLFSPEDKLFFLYLMTNPHTTQLGIYKILTKQIAFELGYSLETVEILLDRFENSYDIVRYSNKTKEIAIKNYLRYSIVKGGKPVQDLLEKEAKRVRDKSLLQFIKAGAELSDNSTVKNFCASINENENDNDNANVDVNENEESWYESYHESQKAATTAKKSKIVENSVENPVENSCSVENSQLKLVGGKLGKGVVFLTDEQLSDLFDKLGFDGFNHYIPKLADFIIKNDAKVANHYATILKWWKEDSGVTG